MIFFYLCIEFHISPQMVYLVSIHCLKKIHHRVFAVEFILFPQSYFSIILKNYILIQMSTNTIVLTPIHRVIVIVLIISQYLLFLFFQILLTHFNSMELSFIPYDSLTIDNFKESAQSHYLWNTLLYLLFWAQHIIMATLKYKISWLKKWNYFPLYDRYIYNVASGLYLWFMLANVKLTYAYLFAIPIWLTTFISLSGSFLFIIALVELGTKIFNPFSIRDILNNRQLTYTPYDAQSTQKLKMNGIYGYVRHPMQGAVILMMLAGNGVYTIQRLIFVSVMSIFVIIGVLMEEKRLAKMFKEYKDYSNKVKARFIPFLI